MRDTGSGGEVKHYRLVWVISRVAAFVVFVLGLYLISLYIEGVS